MDELTQECCQGFHFLYFSANDEGVAEESEPSEKTLLAEDEILRRVSRMFHNRPDILKQLICLENGLEVHLYQGDGFKDTEMELYFIGRATINGDDVIMELSTDEVLQGGQVCDDIMDVVVHEMVHILDLLDDMDGELPGWTESTRRKYRKARTLEKDKIRDGASPLVGYALINDVEFLAVLAEVFFVKPLLLKEANVDLYNAMYEFFQLHPNELDA